MNLTPTDYSIYCPEANQKKIVAEWFEKMGYNKGTYSGSEINFLYMEAFDETKVYTDHASPYPDR